MFLYSPHCQGVQIAEQEHLELVEKLDALGLEGIHAEHVEAHRLGKRPALADVHVVTLVHAEGRRDVSSDVLVALLVTVVLGDVVKVVTAHDDGAVHLVGLHDTLEDAATDGNVAGPGAFLVNVGALDGSLGGLVAKTNLSGESETKRGHA